MIRYTESIAGIEPAHLHGFFHGWPNPPDEETHLRLLDKSDLVVLAREGAIGPVVGFVTALTDGVLCAYIPLLEVLPAYRHQGIGRELMRRLLDRLGPLYMVDVLCDPELEAFYERFAMRPAFAMARRDYERQSGRFG